MLTKQKFVSQVREAKDADHAGRKSVRSPEHEVLCPLVLADGKPGTLAPDVGIGLNCVPSMIE